LPAVSQLITRLAERLAGVRAMQKRNEVLS
jgi:hypothetical protein